METQWFIFIESLISQRSVEQEDSLVHTAFEGENFCIFSEAITFKFPWLPSKKSFQNSENVLYLLPNTNTKGLKNNWQIRNHLKQSILPI